MSWLSTIVGAIVSALLKAFLQGVNDSRAAQTGKDLGAANQKQADTEAAIEAKRQADEVALEPRDRDKTLGSLRDGTF